MKRKSDKFRAAANRFRDKQARIARAMAQGVGGLQFLAQAPPGVGRLVRIPFYLETGVVGFCALTGSTGLQIGPVAPPPLAVTGAIASTTHPVVVVGGPGTSGSTNVATLRTPQISWATLRIVGFEAIVYGATNENNFPLELAVRNLKIGGGINLFVHDDYGSASMYRSGQDTFAGLRDYPLLDAPNTCEVQAQALGTGPAPAADPRSNRISFGLNLVCEVLLDDQTGAHVSGAYARPGAMVRQRRTR